MTAVVLVPGFGDDVQAIKAGIMEIGDVYLLNKADQPGIDKLEHDLRFLISLAPRTDGWTPPIVRCVALNGDGISEALRRCEVSTTRDAGGGGSCKTGISG